MRLPITSTSFGPNVQILRHFNDVFNGVVLFTTGTLTSGPLLSRYGPECVYAYVPSAGMCRVAVLEIANLDMDELLPQVQEALTEMDTSTTDAESSKNLGPSVTHVLCFTRYGFVCSAYLAVRLKTPFDGGDALPSTADCSRGLEYNLKSLSACYLVHCTVDGMPGTRCKRACPDIVSWLVVIEGTTDAGSECKETVFVASPAYDSTCALFAATEQDMYIQLWEGLPTVALVTPNPLGSGYVVNYYARGAFSSLCASVCNLRMSAQWTNSMPMTCKPVPGMPVFVRSWEIGAPCVTRMYRAPEAPKERVSPEEHTSLAGDDGEVAEANSTSIAVAATYYGTGTGVRTYACLTSTPLVTSFMRCTQRQVQPIFGKPQSCKLDVVRHVELHDYAACGMSVELDTTMHASPCDLPHGCKACKACEVEPDCARRSVCANPRHGPPRTYPRMQECVFVPVYSSDELHLLSCRIHSNWMASRASKETGLFPTGVHHAMVCVHMGSRLMHRCWSPCLFQDSPEGASFQLTIPRHTIKYLAENYRTVSACSHNATTFQTISVVAFVLDCEVREWAFIGRVCLDFLPCTPKRNGPTLSASVDRWPIGECAGQLYIHQPSFKTHLGAREVGENDLVLTLHGGNRAWFKCPPRVGPDTVACFEATRAANSPSPSRNTLAEPWVANTPHLPRDDILITWDVVMLCIRDSLPREHLYHMKFSTACAFLEQRPECVLLFAWCALVLDSAFALCMWVNALRSSRVYEALTKRLSVDDLAAAFDRFFRITAKDGLQQFSNDAARLVFQYHAQRVLVNTTPDFAGVADTLAVIAVTEISTLQTTIQELQKKLSFSSATMEEMSALSSTVRDDMDSTIACLEEVSRKQLTVMKKYQLDVACVFFWSCAQTKRA